MALKPFNSVGGFSIGEIPNTVIQSNGAVTTNNGSFTANLVSFNFQANNTANLGNVGNVTILGGSAGQYLQTDGAGNLTWTTANTKQIFNGTSNVSIPVADGNVNTSVGGNANVFVVTGTGANTNGYLTVTGNITAANANLGNLVTANFANLSSNLNVIDTANVGNLRTNNLLYANGQPWDLQEAAGSNTQIQYNDGLNNFGASANFTYNDATQLLTVNGNANIASTLKTNQEQLTSLLSTQIVYGNGGSYLVGSANFTFSDLTNTLTVTGNANVTQTLNGNVANFSGNLTAQNANLGNLAQANYVNVSQQINGNVANFSGNLTAANANLGNLAGANFVNVSSNLNVTDTANVGNLRTDNLLYANGQPWDLQEAAGSNTQIQYNDGSNNFGASSALTFDYAANVLAVTGNIQANNFSTTGSGGNITGANVVSANTFSGTNANVTNINSGGSNLTVNANGYNTVYDNTGNVTFPAGGTVTVGTLVGNVQANITITAANTQVLFSDNGLVAGASGFTFDKVSNLFSTPGNLDVADALNVTNASYINNVYIADGNIADTNGTGIQIYSPSSYVKLNHNNNNYVYADNTGVHLETFGGGNVQLDTAGNVSMSGNLGVTGNIANANNISVTNALNANTGNFSGNITSLNANLGNVADANYIRTGQLYNGSANIDIINNGNIVFSPNIGNVMVVSNVGVDVIGYVNANGNGTFGALYSNTLTAQGGNLSLYSEQAGNTYIQLRPFGNGTVDVGNTRITSLATPNASTDAATKQYVDDVAQGLNVHDSCYAATANTLANLTGGGTITYNNGTGGVGANLVLSGTYSLNYLSANVFDGNVTAVVGSRILVKSEANAATNGIYVVDSATVMTRASDYNTVPEVEAGDFVFVQDGTTYNDTGWVQTSVVTTIGTDPIVFTQFSGAGTYTAGAGLTLTGTVFSVNVDNVTTEISGGNVIVKANAQLTTPNIGAATGTSVDLTGNVLAGNVNSNAKVTAVDFEASGNVLANYINANANLLVNNATVNLALTGNTANFSGSAIFNGPNVTIGNALLGNTASFSGNLVAANITSNGLLSTSNLSLTGNLTTDLNPNANLTLNLGSSTQRYANVFTGNINVSGGANVTGNLTANNFTANIFNANYQVNVGTSQIIYGNVTTSSITSNQAIATAAISGVTGVEFIVKGYDTAGSKYSMAVITAVTDGTSAEYSTFGTVNLGGTTGTLAVNVVGSNIELQVTPSSSNSTVWVTQYRTI